MTERKISKKENDIINVVKPVIEKEGFFLVECCYVEGKEPQVRLFVYNKDNTTVDRLSDLNRKLHPLVSGIDSVSEDFSLEISSPGLYRKFKYVYEFGIFTERNVRISTEDGQTFKGINKGILDGNLTLLDKKNIENIFNIEKIKNASLDG